MKYMSHWLLTLTLTATGYTYAERHDNPSHRHHHHQHITYAKVIKTKPIYSTVRYRTSQKQCHYEKHRVKAHQSSTPIIIGSLIGGAIGNELGHNKTNKKVGAIAGAILGGSIANDIIDNNHRHHTQTQRICRTIHPISHREELVGYQVTYQYHGHRYHTRTQHHPGDRIRIAVSVQPIDV